MGSVGLDGRETPSDSNVWMCWSGTNTDGIQTYIVLMCLWKPCTMLTLIFRMGGCCFTHIYGRKLHPSCELFLKKTWILYRQNNETMV